MSLDFIYTFRTVFPNVDTAISILPPASGRPLALCGCPSAGTARFAPERPLQPDTLYFGGGTPSLLDPADAARLMEAASPLPGRDHAGSKPGDGDRRASCGHSGRRE